MPANAPLDASLTDPGAIRSALARIRSGETESLPPHAPAATAGLAGAEFEAAPDIPAPNYELHPGYGGMAGSGEGRGDRALVMLWPKLAGLLNSYRASYSASPVPPRNDVDDRIVELVGNGIIGLTIDEGLKDLLLRVTEPHVQALRAKRAGRDPRRRTVGSSSVVVATRGQDPEILELFTAVLRRTGALDFASSYKGQRLSPKFVTLQINDETDLGLDTACRIDDLPLSPLHYLHVDTTVFGMKVIIYRTEVGQKNGPFRYILGSNRALEMPLDFCLRKACDKAGLDSVGVDMRRLFLALPPELRKKANFGNDLLAGEPGVDALLSREKLMTSADGDLVLFDNCGMHRGAIFESGERQIFQVLLTP